MTKDLTDIWNTDSLCILLESFTKKNITRETLEAFTAYINKYVFGEGPNPRRKNYKYNLHYILLNQIKPVLKDLHSSPIEVIRKHCDKFVASEVVINPLALVPYIESKGMPVNTEVITRLRVIMLKSLAELADKFTREEINGD